MTVIAIEVLRMSGWSIEKRHCLHILATHYPTSTWAERTAIFNDVCNDNRTANQVRDEYGGHLAGQRVRPNGLKPTRSVQWNDHVCRDEFVTGPFTQQQQTDRGTILDRIQTSISTLGLTRNAALGAVSLVAGMDMADISLSPGNAVVPATTAPGLAQAATPAGLVTTAPTSQASTPSATTAAPFQFGAYASTATTSVPFQYSGMATSNEREEGSEGESSDDGDGQGDGLCDPELANAEWYHSCETKREGPDGDFVFRRIPGLQYDEVKPAVTYGRWVYFSAKGMRQYRIQVCDVQRCEVCGELRSIPGPGDV